MYLTGSAASGIPAGSPRLEDDLDYLSATDLRWTSNNSAGGAFVNVVSPSTGQGIAQLTANAAASFSTLSRGLGQIILPNVFWQFSINCLLPALSVAADRFIIRCGLMDSGVANPSNGVYFEYSDNEAGGNWQMVTAVGGVRTLTQLGSTVAANVLYSMKFNSSNSTSAAFAINNVQQGSQSANFPTGVALGLVFGIYNVTATVNHLSNWDYAGFYFNVSR